MLDYEKIGLNISELRRGLQLTQVEISTLLGVSHQAVSKWENGGCLPDIEVLLNLGKIFNKSVEELLLSERIADSVFPSEKFEHFDESLNLPSLWIKVLDEIRKKISLISFNTWLRNTNAEYVDEAFVIYSSSSFTSEWLYHRYSPLILKTLEEITVSQTSSWNFDLGIQTIEEMYFFKWSLLKHKIEVGFKELLLNEAVAA